MANKKISALGSASTITGSELLPIVQPASGSRGNKKLTLSQLLTYIVNNGTFDSESNTRLLGKAYVTWAGSGFIFDVTYPDYLIDGVQYDGDTDQVTLSASDPGLPRIDVIAVTASGLIVIEGDPSDPASKPTLDPETQIELTFVTVEAGATEPDSSEFTEEIIYRENVEWVGSHEGSFGAGVNFAKTTNPQDGTKHIQLEEGFQSHFPGNVFDDSNDNRIKLLDGTDHDRNDFTHIKFWIKLPAIQSGGDSYPNSTRLYVQFADGLTTAVSDELEIAKNEYNFTYHQSNGTTSYILVTIPLTAFNFTQVTFNCVWIGMYFGNADPNGYDARIDNITLPRVTAIVAPDPINSIKGIVTDNGGANADQLEDVFQLLGILGLKTSASGKIIRIAMDNNVRQVTTSGASIILDFEDLPLIMFVGSNVINGIRSWDFIESGGSGYFDSDDSDSGFDSFEARRVIVRFEMDAAYTQSFPNDVRMPIGTYGWSNSAKTWTPAQGGIYEMIITSDGIDKFVVINGPF